MLLCLSAEIQLNKLYWGYSFKAKKWVNLLFNINFIHNLKIWGERWLNYEFKVKMNGSKAKVFERNIYFCSRTKTGRVRRSLSLDVSKVCLRCLKTAWLKCRAFSGMSLILRYRMIHAKLKENSQRKLMCTVLILNTVNQFRISDNCLLLVEYQR